MIMVLRGRLSAPTNSSNRARGLNIFPFAAAGREFVSDFRCAIKNGHGKSFRFHVQDKVLAHHSQPD